MVFCIFICEGIEFHVLFFKYLFIIYPVSFCLNKYCCLFSIPFLSEALLRRSAAAGANWEKKKTFLWDASPSLPDPGGKLGGSVIYSNGWGQRQSGIEQCSLSLSRNDIYVSYTHSFGVSAYAFSSTTLLQQRFEFCIVCLYMYIKRYVLHNSV